MNHFDGAATRSRNNLLSVQKGTKTMQTRLKFLLGAVAAVTVSGCTAVQDTFQVGEREFSFDTVVVVQEYGEALRFLGFVTDDATDIRMLSQLEVHAGVWRWSR